MSFIENGKPNINKYQRVIDIVKSQRLTVLGIVRATNLKQNQVKVILADLIAQGIVVEVSKYYEFKFDSQALDTKPFEELRNAKINEFKEMLSYLETKGCRMKFLCHFLGDVFESDCGVCDNCKNRLTKVNYGKDWEQKLNDFRETYFPRLEVENKTTNLVNGVAASYYGVSRVGEVLNKCKYEKGGDFPDWLLTLTLKAFYRYFKGDKIDVVLFVPPSVSGNLVKNFAEKVAKSLKVSISYGLKKTRNTQQQKVFHTNFLKRDNLKDAFVMENPNEIVGKSVLIIDDVYDSGATIKEIGKYLSKLGAAKVVPLVIAKTVGGDNSDTDN